jgi:hypothetical protein
MRKDRLRVERTVVPKCGEGLGAEGAFADEEFGIVVQGFEVEDGLMEEGGIVAKV